MRFALATLAKRPVQRSHGASIAGAPAPWLRRTGKDDAALSRWTTWRTDDPPNASKRSDDLRVLPALRAPSRVPSGNRVQRGRYELFANDHAQKSNKCDHRRSRRANFYQTVKDSDEKTQPERYRVRLKRHTHSPMAACGMISCDWQARQLALWRHRGRRRRHARRASTRPD